jgi:hypothetical protein
MDMIYGFVLPGAIAPSKQHDDESRYTGLLHVLPSETIDVIPAPQCPAGHERD